jgi:translation initiation factor IF-3
VAPIRQNGDLRGTPSVRVVGAAGQMLGVMTLAEALRLALKEGLDLVEVNPKAEPPICKLVDMTRYKYPRPKS